MKIPGNVRSYISDFGWMNGDIMKQYLKQVVKPYLNGRKGALIMDDYGAHWRSDVEKKAKKYNIELIKVPPTMTSTLQPLDVSVFGPFKQIRQKLSMEHRWEQISVLDSREEAVNRSVDAFEFIDKKTIQRGFIAAIPTLEGKI